jgi:hypothetical protein
MDADVQLHGGAVLHLHDVQIGPKAVTATVDGRMVSWPKDRLLAQKVMVAFEKAKAGRRARAGALRPLA